MDNLLFATVGPSFNTWKGPTVNGRPASLSSWGQAPCTIPVRTAKVITFPPESLITLRRFADHFGPESVTGIGDHFAPESLITLDRNTHPCRVSLPSWPCRISLPSPPYRISLPLVPWDVAISLPPSLSQCPKRRSVHHAAREPSTGTTPNRYKRPRRDDGLDAQARQRLNPVAYRRDSHRRRRRRRLISPVTS